MAVAVVVTGCDDECTLSGFVDERTADADPTDCGSLYPGGHPGPNENDLEPWRVAHDCAIEAITSRRPFVVRWAVPVLDPPGTYYALLGVGDGNVLLAANTGSRLRTYRCPTIEDFRHCATLATDLCLRCADKVLIDSCD